MTLDEMIQEVALYIGEIITKSGSTYTSAKAKKIVSGINYAISKIVNEKFKLYYKESVTLDSNLSFDTTALNYKFIDVKTLKDACNNNVKYNIYGKTTITCPDMVEGDILTLEYQYSPPEFTLNNIAADFPLPEQNVNPRIACMFSAYFYYDTNGDDRSALWLDKWNDGFASISQPAQEESIIDVYGRWY